MMRPLDNQHVLEIKPLVSPRDIKTRLPINDAVSDLVFNTRQAIRDILHGADRERMLVIVGPCSIHDPSAAYEYADALLKVAKATKDRLLIVMRTYFEKPRTTVGWKGLMNDPHLDGSCDIAAGIELARTILLTINERGMPCACEALDPVTPQYIADLWSWAAIGARTTESQRHREMASGLSMPVGFKNGTAGSTQLAVDAVLTARSPHWFPSVTKQGVSAIFQTTGNESCHVILRGGSRTGPNYDARHVSEVCEQLAAKGLRETVMIDCSHGNSQKDHRKQIDVARDVAGQVAGGVFRTGDEVVEFEVGRRLVMRTADGPFPMETTYTFESMPNGDTRMALRNRGTPSGFSVWIAPFMALAVRRANRKDLALLKRVLEGRAA